MSVHSSTPQGSKKLQKWGISIYWWRICQQKIGEMATFADEIADMPTSQIYF